MMVIFPLQVYLCLYRAQLPAEDNVPYNNEGSLKLLHEDKSEFIQRIQSSTFFFNVLLAITLPGHETERAEGLAQRCFQRR